jgi:hypothetical protein
VKTILSALTLALAILALAAPAAQAGAGTKYADAVDRQGLANPTQSVVSRYDDHRSQPVADISSSSTALNDRIHGVSAPSPALPQPSATAAGTDDGFNWSDAGIGAASAFVAVLLAALAVLATRSRRIAHT